MTAVVNSLAKISYAASHPPAVQLPELSEEIWFSKKLTSKTFAQEHDISASHHSGWYRIARRCLYEEIAVLDQSELHNLLGILNQTWLGNYTKRIDILFSTYRPLPDQEDQYMVKLAAVLRRIPNLRVLILESERPVLEIPTFLCTEISHLPKLKVLAVPWAFSFAWGNDLASVANTSLRSAAFPVIPHPRSSRKPFTEAMAKHILPNLSQIYVPSILSERHLQYHTLFISGGLPSVTSLLIVKTKHRLECILLSFYKFFPCLEYIGLWTTFINFIRGIRLWRNTDVALIVLPDTVHTLGICFEKHQEMNSQYQQVCDVLDKMKANGLSVIRFEEKMVESILNELSASVLFSELFKNKGWRMEAGDMYI
ncbi:hypothetical protein GYMLUDRAFT_245600 [Collybiopsis luxurians FD-317 M1]|uniref:Uncharacterized protein n=1 Tax=Collybiopsis luxurians FD-317 M1 TaxID=944289 RepID=A0A0D0CTR9_9AGAR|nr:hypothetical protein GYMLUDRAFT_245600 [Collybiopsis luxurians FD-317 M1]